MRSKDLGTLISIMSGQGTGVVGLTSPVPPVAQVILTESGVNLTTESGADLETE